MADNKVLNPGSGGATIATDDIAGIDHPRVKVEFGADGSATDVSSANPLPVVQTGTPGLPTGASTAAKQPALGTAGVASADVISVQGVASMTPVKVDGSGVTQPVSGPLTDAQLRAATVPVSGTVTASGPLTDAQLRATAVPVSGPLTDAQLRATAVPVSGTVTASGPLTDAQLRASAVPVDTELPPAAALADAAANPTAPAVGAFPLLWNGTTWDRAKGTTANGLAVDVTRVQGTVTVAGTVTANAGTGTLAVSGPLTDAQLRATAVPTSLATLPALVAGTALVGQVTATPGTTGGWSKQMYAAQTTTVRTVKGTAGTFGGYITIYNPNATVAYVQVFDVATATTVTLGTTVPDIIIPIPPTSAANCEVTNGVNMALGIKLACTTTATGSTAPGTGLDMTVLYK